MSVKVSGNEILVFYSKPDAESDRRKQFNQVLEVNSSSTLGRKGVFASWGYDRVNDRFHHSTRQLLLITVSETSDNVSKLATKLANFMVYGSVFPSERLSQIDPA